MSAYSILPDNINFSRYGKPVCTIGTWELVYYGTLDGRHEFMAEKIVDGGLYRVRIGSVSLTEAKQLLEKMIKEGETHEKTK